VDAIVTARVPVAVKEQVGSILRDIGSTPSQLVNAAYEYVLAEHKLPRTSDGLEDVASASRRLSAEQQQRIAAALEAMYVGPSRDERPFADQLREARDERYASFA